MGNSISNIHFTNFKCFDDLSLEDMGRVNLIGGKNNCGKTALMEAIELLVSSDDPDSLLINIHRMLGRRQKPSRYKIIEVDFIKDGVGSVKLNAVNKKCEIRLEEGDRVVQRSMFDDEEELFSIDYSTLIASVNGEERDISVNKFSANRIMHLDRRATKFGRNSNFIASTASSEREIAVFYGALVDLDREGFLNKSLSVFDKNLVSLKQKVLSNDVVLKVSIAGGDAPVLLSSLGDGVNRYIAILCAIWASKDGYLFIDEIENGIHYTNYTKLWEVVFEASELAKCQVYVTTHSKECIEAFNQVSASLDGAYYELYRSAKTNRINIKRREGEQLAYALTHGGRVRGE